MNDPETFLYYDAGSVIPFHSGCLQMGTLANSEEPDEKQHFIRVG